jgi:hypothetical protein
MVPFDLVATGTSAAIFLSTAGVTVVAVGAAVVVLELFLLLPPHPAVAATTRATITRPAANGI